MQHCNLEIVNRQPSFAFIFDFNPCQRRKAEPLSHPRSKLTIPKALAADPMQRFGARPV
jgi:hypothetical protein